MSDEDNHGRGHHRLEHISTILLAIATVATAWSGYQATRWSGVQANSYSASNAARVESAKVLGIANRQIQVDVAVFIQWIDAYAAKDEKLTAFYRSRMSARLAPAVDPWVATEPRTNPEAPKTPFDLPEYKVPDLARAQQLTKEADERGALARLANQRSDNYVLAVVLFAISLFFAGVGTRLGTVRSRTAILGIGCAVFLLTLVWVATFPVSFGT